MEHAQALVVQGQLNKLGYDAGPADGVWGKRSTAALRAFQSANGLTADGDYGPKTAAVLNSAKAKPYPTGKKVEEVRQAPPVAMPYQGHPSLLWPHQSEVRRVFGEPGNSRCTAGVVKLPTPFRLAWNLDEKIETFRCHALVAAAMQRIFTKAVHHYGEAEFVALRLDIFGGCYNLRQMRGGSSYSMHSWGIAVDLDPERNQLKWNKSKAAFAKPAYESFWNIVESEGAISLGRIRDFDWMHFQFARL